MHSHAEPARGNPLRDHSEHGRRSHIDLWIQGEPEQSQGNEDQEKTSLIKLLVKQILESPNNDEKEYQQISEEFKIVV